LTHLVTELPLCVHTSLIVTMMDDTDNSGKVCNVTTFDF